MVTCLDRGTDGSEDVRLCEMSGGSRWNSLPFKQKTRVSLVGVAAMAPQGSQEKTH